MSRYQWLCILFQKGGMAVALQFIMGGSGSGKSTYLFRHILKEAAIYPHINYLILVPDQFTLETQRTLVKIS